MMCPLERIKATFQKWIPLPWQPNADTPHCSIPIYACSHIIYQINRVIFYSRLYTSRLFAL